MFCRPLLSYAFGVAGGRGVFRLNCQRHSICKFSISTSRQQVQSFFDLFPQNFPQGGPPKESFLINQRQLRREYRALQSEHHPDIVIGSSAISGKTEELGDSESQISSLINKGYTTIRNPYTRIAHFIEINHPEKLDITQDDVAKSLIANFQSSSAESSLEYKEMLMLVLDAHESLEMATNEADLEELEKENEARIEESEETLDKLLQNEPINWDSLMMEAIRLKYWVNIQNGIKDWEPGKPVHLTH